MFLNLKYDLKNALNWLKIKTSVRKLLLTLVRPIYFPDFLEVWNIAENLGHFWENEVNEIWSI